MYGFLQDACATVFGFDLRSQLPHFIAMVFLFFVLFIDSCNTLSLVRAVCLLMHDECLCVCAQGHH